MLCVPFIEECVDFAKAIGATDLLEVEIAPTFGSVEFCCHYNAQYNPISGYLFTKDSCGILHAYKHSVIDTGISLVDVTPVLDDRKYNVFAYPSHFSSEILTYSESTVCINTASIQESDVMYYVYGLIDPRNNKPFYIGKGKDDRFLSHFKESSLKKEGNTRKTSIIRQLNSLGYSPMVEFYAQNIEDEELAYLIEETLIKKYGRIGSDDHGILTNVVESNRPPNHKGRTYSEIYGKSAIEQVEMRRKLQLDRGGYGPRHHSEDTKEKLRTLNSGVNNARYGVKVAGTETAKKISVANKGRKVYKNATIYCIDTFTSKEYIYSNDLVQYCKLRGYSPFTFRSQLKYGWPRSKRGKNNGCLIYSLDKSSVDQNDILQI